MAGQEHALNRLNKPCFILIVLAGMERFAYKGVASNLVTYLTDVMEMSNSSAAKFVNSWVGFTSMLPLVVATVADTYWDRYSTILAAAVLYAVGLLALTSTAVQWPTHKVASISSLTWSLYMISLGQGGYNPSLQAFGVDQLEHGDEEEEEELPCFNGNDDRKSMFFQWWYFGVCCGSLLGISAMSYVQDNLGWGVGFAIPAISMLCSIVMFLLGNRFYIHKRGQADIRRSVGDVVLAIKTTVTRMIRKWNGLPRGNHEYSVVELELQDKAIHEQEDNCEAQNDEDCLHPIHVVLRLLPVWLMLLMFAVIFQQPATFFTKQGMTMRRSIGGRFKIPPAALQSAITISIIVLMPLYDTIFVPLARVLTRNDRGVSVMQRMGIGMFLSVVAMIIAAVVERRRRLMDTTSISIFWLLPQYVVLGISDIFTVVGMQEFFYSEVPMQMRTMGIALYTSVFGVGSFVSAFLITAIEYLTVKEDSWFSDDMRKGRLDEYYCFLAALGGITMAGFVIFCRFFRCRDTSVS